MPRGLSFIWSLLKMTQALEESWGVLPAGSLAFPCTICCHQQAYFRSLLFMRMSASQLLFSRYRGWDLTSPLARLCSVVLLPPYLVLHFLPYTLSSREEMQCILSLAFVSPCPKRTWTIDLLSSLWATLCVGGSLVQRMKKIMKKRAAQIKIGIYCYTVTAENDPKYWKSKCVGSMGLLIKPPSSRESPVSKWWVASCTSAAKICTFSYVVYCLFSIHVRFDDVKPRIASIRHAV